MVQDLIEKKSRRPRQRKVRRPRGFNLQSLSWLDIFALIFSGTYLISYAIILRKYAPTAPTIRRRAEQGISHGNIEPITSESIQEKQPPYAPGVVVLGMHRSGTSMLSGLMVTGMGYQVGEGLIPNAADNVKGFFERVDIVLQNDEFLMKQHANWAGNVINFDNDLAIQHYHDGTVNFDKGKTGLAFLNDKSNSPWLQKDPRMCITLPFWVDVLDERPAILFTYRDPLAVALSIQKRERELYTHKVGLELGLRLWIVYNMRAIQHSSSLCRVFSSNDAIINNPLIEVQRMSDELTSKCGVPAPKYALKQSKVDLFIDPNLQHNSHSTGDHEILEVYKECTIRDFDHGDVTGQTETRTVNLYIKAMRMYCDFENGSAYEKDYVWPSLTA